MNFFIGRTVFNTDCTQTGGERIAKSCFHTNTPRVQDKKIPFGWQQQDGIMASYKLQKPCEAANLRGGLRGAPLGTRFYPVSL